MNPIGTHSPRALLLSLSAALSLSLSLSACPDECEKGSKDCACNDEGDCNSGLVCRDDKCVEAPASCPEGSEGCSCYSNNTCDDHNGVPMACQDSVCVDVSACPLGTLGCACNDGLCQDGLRCNASDVCEGLQLDEGISVGKAAVRSCDLMFDVGSTSAEKVVFDAQVLGKFRKEGQRLALSFTAKTDAPLSGAVAQVTDASGSPVDISAVTPSTLRCYDRLGAVVDAPQVSLR